MLASKKKVRQNFLMGLVFCKMIKTRLLLTDSQTSVCDISLCYKFFDTLQLYKLYNSENMTDDWISLNIQQNFNGRNDKIQVFKQLNYKVGNNLMVNRLINLNNKIPYSWLNESLNTFKVKCKQLLL